jgi:hypothetical protein
LVLRKSWCGCVFFHPIRSQIVDVCTSIEGVGVCGGGVRFLQLAATLGLSVGEIGFLFRKIAYRSSYGLVWCRAKIAKGAMLVPTCIARSLLSTGSCLKNGSHHAPQPPKQLQHKTLYRRGKTPLPHENKNRNGCNQKSNPSTAIL